MKNAKNHMEFRLGELFSGPGGLALGALSARINKNDSIFSIKHVWANDYDEFACETFRKNICPSSPDSVIWKDVKKLDITKLPPIDAFSFGFPCNDFSQVGEKKGFQGEFGPLYTYGIKVLNYFEPLWFVAENVGGLSSANSGNAFQKILEDLESAGPGYNLTAHLYKFEDYGVPQTRHRIIIVGIKKELDLEFKIPKPTHIGKAITVREVLNHPPIPNDAPNNEKTKQSAKVVERLKYIKPGENVWGANLPPHLRLDVKGARLSQIYKRLHPDKPAYTITGSGGGGTHVYHWRENRALTNRERARLQTFPDSYIFKGPKESVRKQIGMAVPPLGAKIVFESILKTFARIKYDTIESTKHFNSKLSPQLELIKA